MNFKPRQYELLEANLLKRKFQQVFPTNTALITFGRVIGNNLCMRVETPFYLKGDQVRTGGNAVLLYFVSKDKQDIKRVGGAYNLSLNQPKWVNQFHNQITDRLMIYNAKNLVCNKCRGHREYTLEIGGPVPCNRCAGKGYQIVSDVERNRRYDTAILRKFDGNFDAAKAAKVDWHPYSQI